jgi:uncharacterized protein (TIGR03435 family)
MSIRRVSLILLALTGVAGAQSNAAAPKFEVATIKFHPEPVTTWSDPFLRGTRVSGTAITLIDLITYAYDLRHDQISGGPNWANSLRYDVTAKAEGDATPTREQARLMMQALLADRFQLQTHRDVKEFPVYALVVGKSGHKLKPSSADATGRNFVNAGSAGMHMETAKGTMDQLARQLTNTAGRRVINRTGLDGLWAYKMDWLPAGQAAAPDSDTVSLFTAIQEQLGLRLEPTKAPIELLIIDRAEKPAEN